MGFTPVPPGELTALPSWIGCIVVHWVESNSPLEKTGYRPENVHSLFLQFQIALSSLTLACKFLCFAFVLCKPWMRCSSVIWRNGHTETSSKSCR